jgi:hypothetical protein
MFGNPAATHLSSCRLHTPIVFLRIGKLYPEIAAYTSRQRTIRLLKKTNGEKCPLTSEFRRQHDGCEIGTITIGRGSRFPAAARELPGIAKVRRSTGGRKWINTSN